MGLKMELQQTAFELSQASGYFLAREHAASAHSKEVVQIYYKPRGTQEFGYNAVTYRVGPYAHGEAYVNIKFQALSQV